MGWINPSGAPRLDKKIHRAVHKKSCNFEKATHYLVFIYKFTHCMNMQAVNLPGLEINCQEQTK